jgi:hypothetical protein
MWFTGWKKRFVVVIRRRKLCLVIVVYQFDSKQTNKQKVRVKSANYNQISTNCKRKIEFRVFFFLFVCLYSLTWRYNSVWNDGRVKDLLVLLMRVHETT